MLALLLSACGAGEETLSDSAIAARGGSGIRTVASGYTVAPVAGPGRIEGRVRLVGDVPADTVVRPTSDAHVCGSELRDVTLVRGGDGLGDVVVWLEGVRSGKPLPMVRRYDIANDDCLLTPRVQAAVTGGTLNVRSHDRVTHRTRFLREGDDEPLLLVTETESGQVVPVEGLMRLPGRIEVRCDQHPWTRAWIAVFDHPYFAQTAPNGAFAIDSIPPGSYTLKAWHERTGLVSQIVVVDAGGRSLATVLVGVRR